MPLLYAKRRAPLARFMRAVRPARRAHYARQARREGDIDDIIIDEYHDDY